MTEGVPWDFGVGAKSVSYPNAQVRSLDEVKRDRGRDAWPWTGDHALRPSSLSNSGVKVNMTLRNSSDWRSYSRCAAAPPEGGCGGANFITHSVQRL